MRTKINKLRHFSILFLTIIIFVIGVLIGGDVEQLRVQNLYTQLQEQDLDYQNLVTESSYINYLTDSKEYGKNISCDLILGSYYYSIVNLDDSRLKLENYINTGSVKEEEFARLKEHYSNIQINYWLLANQIQNLCPNEKLNIILYFYDEDKKCPSCEDQGVHLSYVKQKLKDNVLIFSLDSQKEGPIKLLKQRYGVDSREKPVLVINNEIYGFSNNNEIFDILNISY